jgi:hypothetical protein
MSYFEFYFNSHRRRTLREYSIPLNLARFDAENWMVREETAAHISDALDSSRHLKVISPRRGRTLAKVDKWLYGTEMHGAARSMRLS